MNNELRERIGIITSDYCSKITGKPWITPELTNTLVALIQPEIDKARLEGMKEGVRLFAWWKDGVQHVGTCGTTLEKALADLEIKNEQ